MQNTNTNTTLTADEKELLDAFRSLDPTARAAALYALRRTAETGNLEDATAALNACYGREIAIIERAALMDYNESFTRYLEDIDRPLDTWDYDDLEHWFEMLDRETQTAILREG